MRKLFALILLLMVVSASIAFSINHTDPVPVDTIIARQGNISASINLSGRLINDKTVALTAAVDGQMIDILAREGSQVSSGSVLARLDKRHELALRDKARAELAFQQQAVKSADTHYKRMQNMSRQGNSSRQAMDDSLIRLHSAEAKARIAESALTIAELALENTTITAPFKGTVIEQTVEKGQWVEAGTKLFTLVASDGDIIEAEVDTGDANLVSLGQDVNLSLSASPGSKWRSSVTWIAPAITREDNKPTNTFAIRIEPGAEAPGLMLGEQLDIELITETRENVLLLPAQALTETAPGRYSVHIVEADKARAIAVEVGLQSIDDAQILSGLTATDTVILPAGVALENGMTVAARKRQ